MCSNSQSNEECFATKLGFRVGISITFGILVTAIICNVQMIMVSRHTLAKNTSSVIAAAGNTKEVTTQMMQSGDPHFQQPFKNHSNILVWTDKDNHDLFSLHLQRRLSYLKNTCPALNECTFTFEKKRSEQADIVVIATKRHFPYGGKKSAKTWTLILPDPDYHRAWLRHGSKRHVDLKVLISYLPTADFPLIEPKFIKKQSRGKRKSKIPLIIQEQEYNKLQLPAENDLRLAATIIDECETEGQREEYISALQKHASVHIYGRCGAPCPGWVTEDCLRYLDKHYKFFLVFESHICQHYMSPIFWQLLSSTTQMVPVVFGGLNYADYLPPEVNYIDALNHAPEAIGHTLNYLKANATAFNEYLLWRDIYGVQLTEWPCSLCQTLRLRGRQNLHEGPRVNAQAKVSDGLCTSWPTLDFAHGG